MYVHTFNFNLYFGNKKRRFDFDKSKKLIAESIKIIDEVDSGALIVKMRSDGIIQFVCKEVDEVTVEDISSANEAAAKISNYTPSLNLIILKNFVNVSPEARLYAAGEESNKYTIADAFVIESQALKLVGNFYIKFNKPTRPSKIF